MKGELGDGALYYDRDGEEHQAVITGESMFGNADLTYSVDDSWEAKSMHMAINVPEKDGAIGEQSVYEHKPEADWPQELL